MTTGKWYLLVIGGWDPLRWVLHEERMAFPAGRRTEAFKLAVDDGLLLYMTRRGFNDPCRSRGRIIEEAFVRSPVADVAPPIEIASRQFTMACDIEICGLAPMGQGVELAPL